MKPCKNHPPNFLKGKSLKITLKKNSLFCQKQIPMPTYLGNKYHGNFKTEVLGVSGRKVHCVNVYAIFVEDFKVQLYQCLL